MSSIDVNVLIGKNISLFNEDHDKYTGTIRSINLDAPVGKKTPMLVWAKPVEKEGTKEEVWTVLLTKINLEQMVIAVLSSRHYSAPVECVIKYDDLPEQHHTFNMVI